ncbi:hypothetical protein MJO28_007526 [Puccinia striiformis f. sp. tritici]|uniref:Arrestin C-terminal-like domain-containing protein n=2 Tax=Puccinia striiformis TaxID=27350 RepID=A0A2S4VVB3_9BASI|nr:hypothetical protein Pst134EB_014607 [Puccinia striiformis f. sp. tritici]KAI7951842.1 hypothetical protein MJO28_007526 [Puccinia striiformis f. sp. tritici]POW13443.1 hypothetical protein PSHT_07661 [Puccinia striiformis]
MAELQIHLTEPCLILPGASTNEAITEPRSNGDISRPSLASHTSSTLLNLIKQRPRLNSSISQFSNLWPSSVPPGAGEETFPSMIELGSGKTSMIRGFVVLHVSQAINLNRLSIKFSGTTHTTGPESAVLVPSGNSTILIAEEYTITDANLISAETNPRAPPYSSHSGRQLNPGASGGHSLFSLHLSQAKDSEPQAQSVRETAAADQAGRASSDTLITHYNVKTRAPTFQNSIQPLEERGRRPRSISNPRSSLSLGTSVSHYFHRRSHSANSLHKRATIPLEVDMQTDSSVERSSFVMVNKLQEAEDLFPMYQDSAFHDMLANQYNLLSEDDFISNEQLKSPAYEAHYQAPLSPESIGKNYTTVADLSTIRTPSKTKFQNNDRNRSSTLFKNGIAQFMGALKLKRSSSLSNSLNLRKVTTINASRKAGPPSSESTRLCRPHSTIGQPSKDVCKRGDDTRESSSTFGLQRFGWGRSSSKRRSFSLCKVDSLKKAGPQTNKSEVKEAVSSPIAALTEELGIKRDSLVHEDPFGVSDSSPCTMHVPELPKTTLLKPGIYKYPVVVPVPNHLPPSMTCKHGSISYSLEARLTYQDVQDSTSLTTHQQIPIDLVDPMAGGPSLNPSSRLQLSGEEDAVNEVYSSYSGVNIERTWEDQLYYQIRMDTRKFLVGGKIGFEIQFNPLSRMKIYKFQADIEEKTQYFMDHEKQYLRHCDSQSFNLIKLEQTSPIVLIKKEAEDKFVASKLRASDVPLLPIISADPLFVTKSPLLPHIQVNPSGESDGHGAGTRKSGAISELSSWSDQSGPWNLRFDLRLPGCSKATEGNKNAEKSLRGLNFTCQHSKSPIIVKHYLRLRMRVERGDDLALDKRGRRKKYDIILSSPIQILSCQCKPYSLPAYASSDPTDMTEILSIFKEINATKENSTPSLQCNCIARVE